MSKIKDLIPEEAMTDFYDEQMNRMFFKTPRMEYKHPTTRAMMSEEMDKAISNPPDAVNPSHYKNVACGKQYMELMVDMLRNKKGVEAHLFGQVYKYMFRCGGKDDEVQELNKAKWYLDALIKYKTEGKVL